MSNALVLYLSIGVGCLITGFIALTDKRYENKLLINNTCSINSFTYYQLFIYLEN